LVAEKCVRQAETGYHGKGPVISSMMPTAISEKAAERKVLYPAFGVLFRI